MTEIIDKSSNKANRFKRVAEKRANKVLSSIRLLSQCSNKRSYEYTDAQVNKIFRELRSALKEAEGKFKETKEETGFKL